MIGVVAGFLGINQFRLIAYAVIAIMVTSGVTYWSVHQYNKGYKAAISAIAAEDKEAIDAANEARSRVRDCINSGGVWDTSSGICGGR